MKIIAVTGLIGSGKGEVARHISERYGYTLLDHSRILGEFLGKEGKPITREEKRKLRLERGNTFTAEEIVKEIREKKLEKVVIGSLRRPEEIEITKREFPEAKLIVVESDEGARFERSAKRKQYSDTPKSLEEFREADKKEEKIYSFTRTFQHADFVIENNGSLEELRREVDRVIEEIGE